MKSKVKYEIIEIHNGFISQPILYCPACGVKLWVSHMESRFCRCGDCGISYDTEVLIAEYPNNEI